MKTNSRTINSIKNSFVSIAYNCVTIFITFFAQTIFIKTLGTEYNGVKSLFLNILSMLSIVELGFGTAIVYNLYKPIIDNNNEEIKVIVNFYKKVYRIIAIVIFVLGLIVSLAIPYIVGDTDINENLYLIFILFLLNSVSSYLFSYKRSILYADQKNYIINIVELIFNIFKNVFQIFILVLFKNFILYLLIQIIMTILSNLTISVIVNKKYPYLKNLKDVKDLDKNTSSEIIKKVKGLMLHKLGTFFVTGTDNLLISIGLGIVQVGYYSNYNMIITNVALIFKTMISSVTASIGNLLASTKDNLDKNLKTYNAIVLINSWLYCFGMVSIYNLAEPFITLWIGKEYLLSSFVLLILVINFYTNGIKQASNIFKEAAGVFYEDRLIPIIESILNILFSILFMYFFGLAGVFIGTICSSLLLLLYSYPKYVYKKVLKGKIINYFKLHGFYTFVCSIVFMIVTYLISKISFDVLIVELIVKGIICLILTNLLYLLIVIRTKDFKYLKKLIIRKK